MAAWPCLVEHGKDKELHLNKLGFLAFSCEVCMPKSKRAWICYSPQHSKLGEIVMEHFKHYHNLHYLHCGQTGVEGMPFSSILKSAPDLVALPECFRNWWGYLTPPQRPLNPLSVSESEPIFFWAILNAGNKEGARPYEIRNETSYPVTSVKWLDL